MAILACMSAARRSGSGPEDGQAGSWTSETLPMAVRRELLERELKKLGFRKADAGRGASASEGAAHQQQAQTGHPQAGDDGQHGD
jgi:hypothetical protein